VSRVFALQANSGRFRELVGPLRQAACARWAGGHKSRAWSAERRESRSQGAQGVSQTPAGHRDWPAKGASQAPERRSALRPLILHEGQMAKLGGQMPRENDSACAQFVGWAKARSNTQISPGMEMQRRAHHGRCAHGNALVGTALHQHVWQDVCAWTAPLPTLRLSTIIPGRREARSPESIRRSDGYGFRARGL